MPCKKNEQSRSRQHWVYLHNKSLLTDLHAVPEHYKLLRLAPIKNVNKYLNCVFAVNAKLLNSDDKYYNVTFQLKPFVKCRASAGDCILNAAKEEENFSSVKSLKFQDLWLLKCHDGNVEIWYHRTISRICI